VPGVSVHRFLILALASVGVLIASAILDVGSRASAAYLSTSTRSAGTTAGAGTPTDETPTNPFRVKGERLDLRLFANLPTSAGTSSSGNGPSSPSIPCADLPLKEPPPSHLVVYFREPSARFKLTKYVDSILDPPRPV
jgi:hypothetical protein